MDALLIDSSESVLINRSADEVFAAMSDVDGLFAVLQRKSKLDVERLQGGADIDLGDRWRISGTVKFLRRTGIVEVTEVDRPARLAFRTEGGGYVTETSMAFSPERGACRLAVRNIVTANSFKARLAAPVVRLYRKRIDRGFRKLLKRAKRRIEEAPAA